MCKKRSYFFLSILFLGLILIFGLTACGPQKKKKELEKANVKQAGLITPWGNFTGKEVSGKDLTCIGRYDDMIRVAYNKIKAGKDVVIREIYYKKGDVYNPAKNYFISEMKKCGYEKVAEKEGPVFMPEFKMPKRYKASFKKNKEGILLTVALLNTEGSKENTFVVLNYSRVSKVPNKVVPRKSMPDAMFSRIKKNLGTRSNQLNKMIKPALIKVFKKVKLIDSSEMNMGRRILVRLIYHLKRGITKEDVLSLQKVLNNILKNKGYVLKGHTIEGKNFVITFMKEGKPILLIEGEIDKPIIDVKGVI